MKTLLSLSLLFLSLAFSAFGQTTYFKETKKESKIVDLVASLPEVINADNYVKRITKGKRHLVSFLADHPIKGNPYYHVEVAEDNGMNYYIHFNFFVDRKTLAVKYEDTMDDGKLIPEKECRKKLMDEYRIK
jgi:hypothetical protein